MNRKTHEELIAGLKDLTLPTIRKNYIQMAELARKESLSHEQFLLNLVRSECDNRREKRVERFLKESHLPLEKSWESFDHKRLPVKAAQQARILLSGEFIDRKENLLIFGNPGSGKTHLACAVAQELVRKQCRRVYFTTCALLLQDLLAAKKDVKLKRLLKTFSRFDALLIDDIGYVQQDWSEMEVLFTLLAERYEHGSVIVTSNLPFSKWNNIFKDEMMTAAAVDRIVHHSIILELNIDSYRISTAKKAKLDLNKAARPAQEDR